MRGMRQNWDKVRQQVERDGMQSLPAWSVRWLLRQSGLRRADVAPSERPRQSPPICEDVKAWAQARHAAFCQTILPARTIPRKLPNTLEPEIHEIFYKRLKYEMPEKYLVLLHGARLVGENGLLVLSDGSYSAEIVYIADNLKSEPAYYNPPSLRKRVKKRGHYFSLLQKWSNIGNYYHWMHDVLLRLYRIQEYLPGDIKYVVPPNLLPFQLETLHLLGILDDQLEFFPGDQVWEFDNLYFSAPTTRSGHDLPEADTWLRDLILSKAAVDDTPPTERIFISRRLARYWRIINEDQVLAALAEYGFKVFATEELSVVEQAALFHKAEIVVAPQGSGLTNILFTRPGTPVLDIQEPSNPRYTYWTLSEALKFDYWYMWGQTVSHPHTVPDICVPLDRLCITVEKMLAGARQIS